jgi:ABC-type branched-subunit amino acid transport system permease subunit
LGDPDPKIVAVRLEREERHAYLDAKISLSVSLLVGLVVGGVGSILGSLFGGVPNIAERVSTGLAGAIYGVILLLVIYVMPSGAAGFVRFAVARLKLRGKPR